LFDATFLFGRVRNFLRNHCEENAENSATPTCEKAAENLRISLEKDVQNAVDFLRVTGGIVADKRLRSGGCLMDLNV
jgi:hypothetical protein